MRAITIHLVVERMEDSHLVVPMVVDCVSEELEANAVACAVVAARVRPGGGDEEVGVYGFVEEGVDCVGAGAVLQQWCTEF